MEQSAVEELTACVRRLQDRVTELETDIATMSLFLTPRVVQNAEAGAETRALAESTAKKLAVLQRRF